MKTRQSALAVIVAVLLIGVLLGWGGRHFLGIPGHPAAGEAERARAHTDRLAARLDLSGEQQARLHEILEESRGRIARSRTEWESELEAIRKETNDRIAAILDEGQKKKYLEILEEADRRGRSPHERRGGHGRR
jgi:hypothetical protein